MKKKVIHRKLNVGSPCVLFGEGAGNLKLSNDWRGALSILDGDLVLTVKSKPGLMLIVK